MPARREGEADGKWERGAVEGPCTKYSNVTCIHRFKRYGRGL